MNKKQRIDYLIAALAAFIASFVVFCFVGTIEPYVGDGTAAMAIKVGIGGAAASGLLISAVMLSAHVIGSGSRGLKIVAAVLWPVTLLCVIIAGTLCAIPYQIYNIVKIASDKTQKQSDAKAENTVQDKSAPQQ